MIRFQVLVLLIVALVQRHAAAREELDPAKLAAKIDARLAAGWDEAKVQPLPVVDDATFLRRASLDLIGRIPTVAETLAFLADQTPDKRTNLVNHLIDSGGHARHMAGYWRKTWVPQTNAEFTRLADDFEVWVATRIQANTSYDRIVRELLTAPLTVSGSVSKGKLSVTPTSFYAANENKPENLAASATRAFLGVNLDCAQCHDHPFARWTRDQFWETAAFFAPPRTDDQGKLLLPKVTIPSTSRMLAPALMDGAPVQWPEASDSDTGRKIITEWLVAKENPFFARNAVNRTWAQVFGSALVEPLDDLSGDAGTTGYQAELLKELAEEFTASGYDLKYITRALVLTKAYQLSSVVPDGPAPDPRLFARMPVRGLTGEQLYDSLRTAAGLTLERDDIGRGQGLEDRKRFAAQFYVERAVSAERSISQTLSLRNGRFTAELVDPAKNSTLAGAADAPFLDTRGKAETLFVAVLGRKPSESELAPLVRHVAEVESPATTRAALGDIFWALINTTEFNTNH